MLLEQNSIFWHFYTFFIGWFKRSLNQSIGSFSTNPHFALFRPDRRSDIFGNVSNHWGMVTYTFFWNNFFGSLIRACTGSFANVSAGASPLYIKVGQILELSENGSWVLFDARRFFFCRSWIRACTGRFKKLMIEIYESRSNLWFVKKCIMGCSWCLYQFFCGSLIRVRTGSFANVCAGTSPLYIKVGQILELSENGSWVLVDARRFFFVGHELEHAQEDLKNWW